MKVVRTDADVLVRRIWRWGRTFRVATPEKYTVDDIVRVCATGEAALVRSVRGNRVKVKRAIGTIRPSGARGQTDLVVIKRG